VKKDLNITI